MHRSLDKIVDRSLPNILKIVFNEVARMSGWRLKRVACRTVRQGRDPDASRERAVLGASSPASKKLKTRANKIGQLRLI